MEIKLKVSVPKNRLNSRQLVPQAGIPPLRVSQLCNLHHPPGKDALPHAIAPRERLSGLITFATFITLRGRMHWRTLQRYRNASQAYHFCNLYHPPGKDALEHAAALHERPTGLLLFLQPPSPSGDGCSGAARCSGTGTPLRPFILKPSSPSGDGSTYARCSATGTPIKV
ncbi:unnamed protein product [Colias eurytheme]|nr:unnamed protein product [Colias eurytheme]